MMYQEKLAVAIKVNGKVLREAKSAGSEKEDTVFIPFGSHYTIYVKNMNSVRALVRFEIDGTDATEGVSIIVPANGYIELERFIKNGNYQEGLKFKFIERTKKIEDGPRGIQVEDGLIRVEYEFEREPAKIVSPVYRPTYDVHHYHHRTLGEPMFKFSDVTYSTTANTISASAAAHDGSATMDSYSGPELQNSTLRSASRSKLSPSSASSTLSASAARVPQPESEKGITVGGAKSDQSFHIGEWFPTDGVKHVMIIKVFGETEGGKAVSAPVTVKTKIECPTCGTKNKFGTKFCRECGTGLEQV